MNYKSVVEHYINSVGYDASEEDKQCIMNIILYEKNKSVKEIIDKLTPMQKKLLIAYCSVMHRTFIDDDNNSYLLIKTVIGYYIFKINEDNSIELYTGNELFDNFKNIFVQSQEDKTTYDMLITYGDYILYKISAKAIEYISVNNLPVNIDGRDMQNYNVYNYDLYNYDIRDYNLQHTITQADKVKLENMIKTILDSRTILKAIAGECWYI